MLQSSCDHKEKAKGILESQHEVSNVINFMNQSSKFLHSQFLPSKKN